MPPSTTTGIRAAQTPRRKAVASSLGSKSWAGMCGPPRQLSDLLHQAQARIRRFHHDIHERDRQVGMLFNQNERVACGVGV